MARGEALTRFHTLVYEYVLRNMLREREASSPEHGSQSRLRTWPKVETSLLIWRRSGVRIFPPL